MPETDATTRMLEPDPREPMTLRIAQYALTWDEDPSVEVLVTERVGGWHVSPCWTMTTRGYEHHVPRLPEYTRHEAALEAGGRLLQALITAEKARRRAEDVARGAFDGVDG